MQRDYRKELEEVMAREPRLTSFGIWNYGKLNPKFPYENYLRDRAELIEDDSVLKINEIIPFIAEHLAPIKTLNRRHTSYGLKHTVEHHIGYITNGQFIAAALILGYRHLTSDRSPNVCFAISEKSIVALDRLGRERR